MLTTVIDVIIFVMLTGITGGLVMTVIIKEYTERRRRRNILKKERR